MSQPETSISALNQRSGGGGVVFGDVLYRPGGTFGPRVQEDYQLVIVHEGEATVWVDRACIEVPARHAVLLRPGPTERFQFSRREPTRHTWCAVAPVHVPEDLAEAIARAPQVRPLRFQHARLMGIGFSLREAPDALWQNLGRSLLWMHAAEPDQGLGYPPPLERALAIIERRLSEPLDLPAIAQEAGISVQYMGRLFRQHLQTSPARYLWAARAREGVNLLRETGLTVAQISERVGFANPYHFSRTVQRQYGASPSELRRSARDRR